MEVVREGEKGVEGDGPPGCVTKLALRHSLRWTLEAPSALVRSKWV